MTREEAIEILSRPKSMKGAPAYILMAHDMAIEALEQTAWIPVSERLPEEEMNCLVTDSLENVHEVTFYPALDGRESYFSGCYCVRAWMPLPEPYKKGESEIEE